jgi:uroporphyrinogen decarboxylase
MSDMTHRDRVMKALNHQEPDRVPIDFGSTRVSTILSGAYERLRKQLGVGSETLFTDKTSGRIMPDADILERFDVDTRMLPLQSPLRRSERTEIPTFYEDQWGVVWRVTSDGRYYVWKPPFAGRSSIHDLSTHRWPDPDASGLTEGLKARAKALRETTDCAIVLELPGRVFSLGQNLCGFEDWLVTLVTNSKFTQALLDTGVEIESQMARNILGAVGDNVDVILCATDDLGMQTGPLISPDLYRKLIKPFQRRLFNTIKSHTEAKLLFHSDGAIVPLVGDLIDIGVEVLNPVQVSAVGMGDTKWLKKEFGQHLSFWGAVDTQNILPFGTPEQVKEEVKRRIEDLASGGGYVLASVHNVQAEVPPENICAMLEAAKQYGGYD